MRKLEVFKGLWWVFCSVLVVWLSSPAGAECYSYDEIGRLKAVDYDGDGAGNSKGKREYYLDDHGNRTSVTVNDTGGSCVIPSGSTTPPGQAPASNMPLSPDIEQIGIETNGSFTVYPLEGDGGSNPMIVGISETSSLFAAVLVNGNAIDVTAFGVTGGPANITYSVIDDNNTLPLNGTIKVTVLPVADPAISQHAFHQNPCVMEPDSPECIGQ